MLVLCMFVWYHLSPLISPMTASYDLSISNNKTIKAGQKANYGVPLNNYLNSAENVTKASTVPILGVRFPLALTIPTVHSLVDPAAAPPVVKP